MFTAKFYEAEKDVRPECVCHYCLPAGRIGRLGAGVVDVQPGGRAFSCRHTAWRQVYFILDGKGRIVIDGADEYPVEKDMVVEIPYDAEHKLVADESGPLRYLYVNDYSHPVLATEQEASADHERIHDECDRDLERGQSMWIEPPPPMPEQKNR